MLLFSTVFYSTSKRDERVDINAIKNYFYDAEQMLIKKGDACDKYNIVSNDVIKGALVEKVKTGCYHNVLYSPCHTVHHAFNHT